MKRTTGEGTRAARFIAAVTDGLGSMPALYAAVGLILLWAISGPLFGFSNTWQLLINTVTTLVTFVMVFVIQNSQNRDSRALQVKLDEILYVLTNADDELVGIEDLSEKRIKALQAHVRKEAADDASHSERPRARPRRQPSERSTAN
jgi:low affinity Fe/Cu permease